MYRKLCSTACVLTGIALLWAVSPAAAQAPEACCLPDGTCIDVPPNDCLNFGGTPMGPGTICAQTDCVFPDEQACCLPDGTCVVVPPTECIDRGGTPMPYPTCDGVVCDEPADYRFEFSVDIGSDHELSDPFMDGDEAFDPGDVYWWQGPPVLPPGRDGFKDDLYIFGFDPYPDPPDPGLVTRVPVGTGTPDMFAEYFDLDGHDQIDVDIFEMQWIPPDWPLEFPIPEFDSPCVFPIEFLMISFDDDGAPSWPAMDVPVTAPSPAGVSSYGSTPGRDEIFGVTLTPGVPPYGFASMYPIADEITVHTSLAANPDGMEEEDDDVDSLDIVRDQETCPYWYFTADHEAYLGLDPGDIYEVTAGGPTRVIDNAIHLGLPDGVDIDAFEFVFMRFPEQPGLYFGIVFSVDDDDPLTPQNESGGLNPAMLYGSFFMGYSFPILVDPLWDDVDAITTWVESLEEPQPPVGACCLPGCGCTDMIEVDCIAAGGVWAGAGTNCADTDGNGVADVCETCAGDANCDGFVDLNDLAIVLANYGTPSGATWPMGDFDGDGDVDLADLSLLLSNYGNPCP